MNNTIINTIIRIIFGCIPGIGVLSLLALAFDHSNKKNWHIWGIIIAIIHCIYIFLVALHFHN